MFTKLLRITVAHNFLSISFKFKNKPKFKFKFGKISILTSQKNFCELNLPRTYSLQIICPFDINAWCPLKTHTYLNKPAAESCRFVLVYLAFLWTTDIKGWILCYWRKCGCSFVYSPANLSKKLQTKNLIYVVQMKERF